MEGFKKVYLMCLKLRTTRCSGRIFMSIERTLNQWFLWKKSSLHERIQKDDVSIDGTAIINIPEDAVKQYGSMVALR